MSNEGKNRVQSDGMLTSKWLQCKLDLVHSEVKLMVLSIGRVLWKNLHSILQRDGPCPNPRIRRTATQTPELC